MFQISNMTNLLFFFNRFFFVTVNRKKKKNPIRIKNYFQPCFIFQMICIILDLFSFITER